MDITPIIPSGLKVIRGYGNNSFKINDEEYSHSIVVFQNFVTAWDVKNIGDITHESLFEILNQPNDIELLLIGCGETHSPLPSLVFNLATKHKINVEIMTTGAACRTYNVLLAEGRKVAAALLLV